MKFTAGGESALRQILAQHIPARAINEYINKIGDCSDLKKSLRVRVGIAALDIDIHPEWIAKEPGEADIAAQEKIRKLFDDPILLLFQAALWRELRNDDSSLDDKLPDMALLLGNCHQEGAAILIESIIPCVKEILTQPSLNYFDKNIYG